MNLPAYLTATRLECWQKSAETKLVPTLKFRRDLSINRWAAAIGTCGISASTRLDYATGLFTMFTQDRVFIRIKSKLRKASVREVADFYFCGGPQNPKLDSQIWTAEPQSADKLAVDLRRTTVAQTSG